MTRPKREPKPSRPKRPRVGRPRGQPSTLRMPDPIDAPVEEIIRKCLSTPPPREWRYLKDKRRRH